MKRCPHCKIIKPTTDFWKDRGKSDGLDALCITCAKPYRTAWRMKNRKQANESTKTWQRRLRDRVLRYYCKGDPHCQCPGCTETNPWFLTLDHVNNDGAAHRKALSKGENKDSNTVIRWIVRNDFPPGFQVLCYNCNCGKQRMGKQICPHLLSEV